MYSTLNNLEKINGLKESSRLHPLSSSSSSSIIQENSDDKNVYIIDLRSDTISKPTPEMRKAMFEAKVGDDVYGEDPTVKELETKSAKLFGKEAGLFVPSGTMANLLAIMVHCNRRGSEAIVGDLSHTFLYEQGNASQLAGVQLATIKNQQDGTFCLNELKRKIRSRDLHEPITSLVIIENTHNMCGGRIIPLEWIENISKICSEYKIPIHMDGARVFNACEELNLPPHKVVKDITSVCFCLSKGLSAPVGSVLVGSNQFICEARRFRKALGGGMRQAGILAAAGIVGLDTIVPKLKQTHLRIKRIGKAIDKIKSKNIKVDLSGLQTNILLIQMTNKKLTANNFSERLAVATDDEIKSGIQAAGGKGLIIKVSSRDWEFVRVVIYDEITDLDIDLAIKKLNYVIEEFDDILSKS